MVHDHKALDDLNEQIAAETSQISDLQNRIRVMDIEIGGWKPVEDRLEVSPRGSGYVIPAFLVGLSAIHLLGRVVRLAMGL